MLLPELRTGISRTLALVSESKIIDAKVATTCLDEIALVLTQSEVLPEMVRSLGSKLDEPVHLDTRDNYGTRRRAIYQGVFHELCKLFHAGIPAFAPEKGKPCVVLFVSLKGSGKEVLLAKYAYYHKLRGYVLSLVCAGRFRPGVFDELSQYTKKVKIPVHGCHHHSDGLKIARAGLIKFKETNSDLIIVDTHARHEREADLFEEMLQVAEATKPDLVIFTMDGTIGSEATFEQTQKFKANARSGAIILIKMDGRANGGGVFSSLSLTPYFLA